MTTEVSTDTRAELIADLRALADTLERFPHLPAERWISAKVQYSILEEFGDEEARVKEVRRIAAILGVEPDVWPTGVSARLDCGEAQYVVYTAVGPTS